MAPATFSCRFELAIQTEPLERRYRPVRGVFRAASRGEVERWLMEEGGNGKPDKELVLRYVLELHDVSQEDESNISIAEVAADDRSAAMVAAVFLRALKDGREASDDLGPHGRGRAVELSWSSIVSAVVLRSRAQKKQIHTFIARGGYVWVRGIPSAPDRKLVTAAAWDQFWNELESLFGIVDQTSPDED